MPAHLSANDVQFGELPTAQVRGVSYPQYMIAFLAPPRGRMDGVRGPLGELCVERAVLPVHGRKAFRAEVLPGAFGLLPYAPRPTEPIAIDAWTTPSSLPATGATPR